MFASPFRLALAAASVLACGLAPATAQTAREVRGVWIPAPRHTSLWSSKATLAEQMDYYASRGFNVVYPVVWAEGYTLYPSAVMQQRFGVEIAPTIGAARRNMLDELIVEARRVGIEVIPWFEYGFASFYGDSGGHILHARPDWAARDRFGNFAIQYRDPGTGTGFTWMNGIHPEVQDFMLDLIREVAETFDVDGIQGDDRLPAMPVVAGYDAYTVALYRSEHGGLDPPQNPSDPAFRQWKANKLTAFGGRLFDTVRAVDPELIVSMSPSIFPFGRDNYLQDWPAWLAAGQVDHIHPQAYRWTDVNSYKQLIREMVGPAPGSTAGHVRPEHRSKLFPGIVSMVGSQRNGPAYLREAVRFNREFGLAGEVFFFNEGMRERNEFAADTLFRYHYGTPALLPGRTAPRRRPATVLSPASPGVTLAGTWTAVPTVAGFFGPMRYAEPGTGSRATYPLDVAEAGVYDVYAFQPTGFATRMAHYTLTTPTDTTVAVVDQLGNTNVAWTRIAQVRLAPGMGATLTVDPDRAADPEPQLRRTFAEGVMLQLNRRASSRPVSNEATPVPLAARGLQLGAGVPNPSRGQSALPFTLDAPSAVSAQVFDLVGRRVAAVAEAAYGAGAHQLRLDLGGLPSGTYLVRVEAEGRSATRAVTVAR